MAGVYAQPDRSSEQVTQAVIGQVVRSLEEAPGWLRIKTPDDYSGWVESRCVVPDQRGRSYAAAGVVARVANLFADIYVWPDPASDILTKAFIGVELEIAELRDEWVVVRLPDGNPGTLRRFAVELVDRAVYPLPLNPTGYEIAATAKRFIGVPYLWGGVTPFGLDCSGFVQLVHKLHSILLPRDAYLQADDIRFAGVPEDSIAVGDLLFFGRARATDATRAITHVGIALGGGRFIHSCGGAGVCISELADPQYSKIFRQARRLL